MAQTTALSVLDAARAATNAGIVVLPVRPDGSKRPDVALWKRYQSERPSADELRAWFGAGTRYGLGFVCGAVSGGLELFEFEDREAYRALLELAEATGASELVERIASGYEEQTPGGGIHWLYRCEEIRGNTKLATTPCPGEPECSKHEAGKQHVLVESRGEGGWVVVAPSHGPVHASQRPYELLRGGVDQLVTLTIDERDELWALARTLDEWPRDTAAEQIPSSNGHSGSGRPGDIYNDQATWNEVLQPAGWMRVHQRGGLTYWRRPGARTRGIDATTGRRSAGDPTSDYLWVFSTSVPEFNPGEGYSKWRAFARLQHRGDYQAAARDLRSRGYTVPSPGPLVVQSAPPQAQETPQEAAERPYCFEPVFPPTHFVSRYVAMASQKSDAAHEYHEAIACLLLGAVTPGVRARLSAWPHGLAVNLYVVLVGSSTRSRKSTAINEARSLLHRVLEDAIFPDHFSAEAMLEQLAMRARQPSVWFPDELGEVLEDAAKKPLLNESLLRLYDCPPVYDYARHSKRVKGGGIETDHDRVQEPHWSVLGAATEAIFDTLSSRSIQSGLLPRFAYIFPEQRPPRMGLRETTPSMEQETGWLADYLKYLALWARETPEPEVVFAPGSIEVIDRYMYEVEKTGEIIIARLPAMAVKLAMIGVIGQDIPTSGRIVVEPRHAEQAVALARKWQGYALRFGNEVGGFNPIERKFQQRLDKALAFVRQEGGIASRQDVMRYMRVPAKELDEIQRTLVEMEYIEIVMGSNSGPGRPSVNWKLLSD